MELITKNKKYNGILNEIYNDIKETFEEDYKREVTRYYNEFKNITSDYNIAQYGNLLIYYYDVRKFLIDNGFTNFEKKYKQPSKQNEYRLSDTMVWNFYKRLVGIVVRYIVNQ